ncbi:hypothetical protein LOZ52_006748 [Ophidiomyces ophidiicola]|uniref:uncharacterized protein n=1 Tax=Ophidiomyces ophidiicola TaxID=1387563 RepID=UPI0020C248FD|nr:uncharacterized protein LOZ57_006741 [Ophidiomyces ophidiicola]KAI1936674.1 hypothetical protein LOZ57_006741 [Ophidiomyces ophidiicola]KAI2001617.1 hypothetical protein LOZ49_006585 [Ophidiomyces ophidiicola]KAI2043305.1 hypothetical protein LOZ43_006649 [Ophidiomyces ophidiicola]KAI2127279.1 hypothetical protein LOZ29_006749 [Ophidiomyces ophidiicola]KAI2128781.1 hypothetical protein LOZ28_006775 [Ophidiomyces ophidiicola]
MDPSQITVPPLKDLTIDNITENTILINSQCPDARMKFVMDRLVTHLHDFARETRLSTQEWMTGLLFLTEVGKMCTDVRQEFILLSDVLGLSLLIDAIDHPKPPGSTEGTVLGPFHTHDAEHLDSGDQLSHDPEGEPLLVTCTVTDTSGNPIEGVKVDIWETDSTGHYDVQHPNRTKPDGRGVLHSDAQGAFWFKAIKPVPYPIPHDGPVGKMLTLLKRHPYRPAHMHFMFEKPGFDHLISSLFLRGDPFESSDAVFGVKSSLVVDTTTVTDPEMAAKYGVPLETALITHDFVLVSEEDTKNLRDKNSTEALSKLGQKVRIVNGLPVPDLD